MRSETDIRVHFRKLNDDELKCDRIKATVCTGLPSAGGDIIMISWPYFSASVSGCVNSGPGCVALRHWVRHKVSFDSHETLRHSQHEPHATETVYGVGVASFPYRINYAYGSNLG